MSISFIVTRYYKQVHLVPFKNVIKCVPHCHKQSSNTLDNIHRVYCDKNTFIYFLLMFYLSFEEISNSELIIIGLQLSDLQLCSCKMYRMCPQRSPRSPCFCQHIQICHTKLPAVLACACRFFMSPYVTRLDSIFMTMETKAKH